MRWEDFTTLTARFYGAEEANDAIEDLPRGARRECMIVLDPGIALLSV